jgi:predicted transcriptional regulator
MSELGREIIEALILDGTQTGEELAETLKIRKRWTRRSVMRELQELARQGQIRTWKTDRPGDTSCVHCGRRFVESEPGDRCPRLCGGWLVDDCAWVFCGGPISQALSISQ